MAASEYFVDPSINANSGTGTIGDPYGDLQYAFDSVARNSTDGDIFHVKAGTAEVLGGTGIDLTSYSGGSSATFYLAPVCIRGYASAANDGGIASIDCGGGPLNYGWQGINLRDLYAYNGGSSTIVGLNRSTAINVMVEGSSDYGFRTATTGSMFRCVSYDTLGIWIGNSLSTCMGCYVKEGPTNAVNTNGALSVAYAGQIRGCIVDVSGVSAPGIKLTNDGDTINNCTVYHRNGNGTSTGIGNSGSLVKFCSVIADCVVEGFNGTGGHGIQMQPQGEVSCYIGSNSAYGNATNFNVNGIWSVYPDNESCGSSVIAKSGTVTMSDFVSDNEGFWQAVEDYYRTSGAVSASALNYGRHRGAVPPTSGGGVGTTVIVVED